MLLLLSGARRSLGAVERAPRRLLRPAAPPGRAAPCATLPPAAPRGPLLPAAVALSPADGVSVEPELAELLAHPAMWDPALTKARARRKLVRRHAAEFASDALFDRLGRAACAAGVLPRKELFETWAVALRIHAAFPEVRRVADVASGHGLLAWILLLLDDETRAAGDAPRTAVCVDRRMPASAEAVEAAVMREWPALAGRWRFVEADAAELEPHPSCLLAAVHACGSLSDALVGLALAARAPLALVPCCHSLARWEPHALAGCALPTAAETGLADPDALAALLAADGVALADFVDGARAAALRGAGYAVRLEALPLALTAKNRLLLGTPAAGGAPRVARRREDAPPPPAAAAAAGAAERARPAAPRLRRPGSRADVRVPLADEPAALAVCAALSGRACAVERKAPPSPMLDMSIWLPPSTGAGAGAGAPGAGAGADDADADAADGALSARALAALAEGVADAMGGGGVRVRVYPLDAFTNSAGRTSRAFRLEYVLPTRAALLAAATSATTDALRRTAVAEALAAERELALSWHRALQERHLSAAFPGAEVRGSVMLKAQFAQLDAAAAARAPRPASESAPAASSSGVPP